jgi:hypothetical protein
VHWLKVTVCVSICVLLGTLVAAQQNKFGVADKYTVSFHDPVRVGDTLLPKGDYEIRHSMKGEEHIMVFRQVGRTKPVEVSTNCTLVPLLEKAGETRTTYILNAANERVLHELVFKGDSAKHVF